MAVATTLHIRVDAGLKSGAEEVLEKIGISVSDFVTMSLKRLTLEQRIPFSTQVADARVPENMRIENRAQLVQVIEEAFDEDDGSYHTFDEVFAKLGVPER